MLVQDFMTLTPIRVSPDTSINHAIQLMLDHHVSGLPVVGDDDRVVGMLTEGDLLSRSAFNVGSEPLPEGSDGAFFENYVRTHGTTVGDCMTRELICISPEQPLADAAVLARSHNIKRLPVIQSGKLVGIISRRDILRAIKTDRDVVAKGDDALRLAVATRLRAELGLEAGRLKMDVKDSIVEILAPVPSAAQKRAIRVVAESVAGIAGVSFRDHENATSSV
ncbi:CBS domain-containing protein [Neorhizobium sp. BETTINA12A]|uniref:CBS domain-containing protein n=1 Tax=Neorhizobium sp. BETTINA12A TaxID=2908924 RepID=UPI001FF50553|nr:CBS domain-containing protein [Neorhizobium sp. BETTINA12A]MCJ9749124.1 CBS domain-containing protein [Neorhizobium sp. BETTINA12A]